jgi:hypothetical protein
MSTFYARRCHVNNVDIQPLEKANNTQLLYVQPPYFSLHAAIKKSPFKHLNSPFNRARGTWIGNNPERDIMKLMKNAVFWDVAPCRSCVNRHFGGTHRLHLQRRKLRERGTSDWWLSLQPPTHAGSKLADFSTLKMGAIRSSETSVHTRSTRRHIPEDGILHSHRRGNL